MYFLIRRIENSHWGHNFLELSNSTLKIPILNLAIEEAVLVRNPAGIKVKIAHANQSVLNKNKIEIFFHEVKSVNHRFYQHWTFAILTGMRSGKLHSLRWAGVDFVTGIITISKECRKFLQESSLNLAALNISYPGSGNGIGEERRK